MSTFEGLQLRPSDGVIVRLGQRFDELRLRWIDDETPVGGSMPISVKNAATHVLSRPRARRVPVGVIGPSDATPAQYERARQLGTALHHCGFTVICGGRSGAMEGVCRGVSEAGGMAIGILPDGDWNAANDYVAIPIASGIGEARNAIIASAAFALVAVGGGYGTLSDMALGLRLGRLVIAMPDSLDVDGAVCCNTVDDVLDRLARRYLALG